MRRGESVALLVFQPHKYSMPHQVRQAHFYIYFNEYDLAEYDLCAWHVTVQTGCSCCSLSAQSIHLREKNIAGPTERSSKGGVPPLLIARREGPAFFDEDDLCAAI